jgi:hypothetical protein
MGYAQLTHWPFIHNISLGNIILNGLVNLRSEVRLIPVSCNHIIHVFAIN